MSNKYGTFLHLEWAVGQKGAAAQQCRLPKTQQTVRNVYSWVSRSFYRGWRLCLFLEWIPPQTTNPECICGILPDGYTRMCFLPVDICANETPTNTLSSVSGMNNKQDVQQNIQIYKVFGLLDVKRWMPFVSFHPSSSTLLSLFWPSPLQPSICSFLNFQPLP